MCSWRRSGSKRCREPERHAQPSSAKQPPGPVPPASLPSPRPASAPDYVVYRQVFHHLMALKDRANEVERRGGNGRALGNYYKDRARLNDDQELTFEKIAADCERDVAKLDAQAQRIIDAAHARFPNGKVPAGAQIPPPPPELQRLQQQRIATISSPGPSSQSGPACSWASRGSSN